MSRRRAFTLVELLVVIGIIAVLIGVLLPALNAARRQAGTVKCAAALREIGNCYKMYELESKGYWPLSRMNAYLTSYPTGTQISYNIDGVDYPTASPANGQAYWFTFLAKYVTKSKVGNAAGTDATQGAITRQSIFYNCPAWEGYKIGGIVNGDTNLVQPGYGANTTPGYQPNTTSSGSFPAGYNSSTNVIDIPNGTKGIWYKASKWNKPTERMVLSDSRFWLAQAGTVPVQPVYPPAVVAQPNNQNTSAGVGSGAQTTVDMYRHGVFPPTQGNNLDPWKGKIVYNILYADGHVTTHNNGRDAYKSIRMKFPG